MSVERELKIAFIGGGSQSWAPTIIRDIIFKKGMEKAKMEFALLDLDLPRAKAIERLFEVKLREWGVDRVKITVTGDSRKALAGADFVIIAISTGRLPAMRHDLAVPEKYGIYHTVGDTAGPGGWARALRNIPVFKAYAEEIKRFAPNAYVLNYTNPMGVLTGVLARELGESRVVGLCHGLFSCRAVLSAIFGLKTEDELQVRFGGLNHFFWILDFQVNGEDGYALLRQKMGGRNLAELVTEIHKDGMGFSSKVYLAGELLENFGCLPYVGDRHTCEFFNCYMTDKHLMERFRLVRTTIEDREKNYAAAEKRINDWTEGRKGAWPLLKKPSRETAADIIHAIAFRKSFTDVVNTVNAGQIANLPAGAVVETMGYVSGRGFAPITAGPLPEPVAAVVRPHAEVQLKTLEAGLSGDLDGALQALIADPICAHMTASDIREMGMELLKANSKYLPQFFGK